MRTAVLALVLALAAPALASERRPHVTQDECSRRGTACEQRCDEKAGMDRLSCKTDCRLAETQCRNARK